MRGPTFFIKNVSNTHMHARTHAHARARTLTRTYFCKARAHISAKVALALGKPYLLHGEVACVEAMASGEEVTSCDRGLIKGDHCTYRSINYSR